MKKRMLLIFAAVAIISILSTGTLAYYSVYAKVDNVITSGSVSVQLHNQDAQGTAIDQEGVVCIPGSVFDRVVTVENTGEQPVYVRISMRKYVEASELTAEDCLNVNVDTKNWTLVDGYYYYNVALEPGQITLPLFNQVQIDPANVNNDYLGKTLMLDVFADAVQSRNNAASVFDAVGWPVE